MMERLLHTVTAATLSPTYRASRTSFTNINNLMVAAGNTKVSFFLRVVRTVAVGRGGLLCKGSTWC